MHKKNTYGDIPVKVIRVMGTEGLAGYHTPVCSFLIGPALDLSLCSPQPQEPSQSPLGLTQASFWVETSGLCGWRKNEPPARRFEHSDGSERENQVSGTNNDIIEFHMVKSRNSRNALVDIGQDPPITVQHVLLRCAGRVRWTQTEDVGRQAGDESQEIYLMILLLST